MSVTTTTERTAQLSAMTDLLQFLNDHPEIPIPYWGIVNAFVDNADALDPIARAMAPCKKAVVGSHFSLDHRFGSQITLSVNFERDEVCKKVVVGHKKIPETIVEARTVEVVEWECPDGILRRA